MIGLKVLRAMKPHLIIRTFIADLSRVMKISPPSGRESVKTLPLSSWTGISDQALTVKRKKRFCKSEKALRAIRAYPE